MNNLYKEAMDEINISDQCLRKVKSMNNNNKKIKKTCKTRNGKIGNYTFTK